MAVTACAAALYSCDDSTSGVGDFVSNIDKIEAFSSTYEATSQTEIFEKIYSRTNRAYLGKYTDSNFGEYSAGFITQINCPEGFEFPERLEEITGASLELYYTGFYGDSLATLTVQVDKLNKVIDDSDDELYYTNYKPENYYNEGDYIAQKSYAAVDKSISDSLRNSEGYYPNIKIDLGEEFRKDLNEKSKNPDNFKDANTFINNVLKGFYVHTVQGDGSIVYIKDIWLRMNMKYTVTGSQGQDSTAVGSSILAASKEVLMSTRMENKGSEFEKLKDEKENTYLKTPAGLYTEITLPIENIYESHKDDTLNSVTLSIKKYRYAGNAGNSQYKMGVPQNVIMIRKGDMNDFFEKNKTYDNETSFIGTYDSSTNSYSFSKLNRLISHIFTEIRQGNNETDRDVVVLIPVTTETDTKGNIIGVSHDMEVNAARLFGGEEGEKLKMEVIYTRP